MPLAYTRDDERRLIIVHVSLPITVGDWLHSMHRQVVERTWHYGTLLDTRELDETPSTTSNDDLWDIAAEVKALATQHGPRGPVAIVTNNRLTGATAGMYRVLANGAVADTRVFSDRQVAEAWLTKMVRKSEG